MIKKNDPYYASGMWGQQETKGRSVIEEITVRYVGVIYPIMRPSSSMPEIVERAIELATETVRQLAKEKSIPDEPKFGVDVREIELLKAKIAELDGVISFLREELEK